jgi:hypothetical protein
MDAPRAPLAPLDHNSEPAGGQAQRRLRSLFTPWKGSGGGGGGGGSAASGAAPPVAPVALRAWGGSGARSSSAPASSPLTLTLTLAQQHALPGGRGRALAFDLASGGSPALYAGDGATSLKKLSLLSPGAPLALRLPAHSRGGARAIAPPAHPGCHHLAGVATVGAGLVMVSGQTGNPVAVVPFASARGGGGGGGPAPGASAAAWSVAWSPLRPTHELLVGLDGGRVATVDLRCAASSASSSSSSSCSGAQRAVLSVVRAVATPPPPPPPPPGLPAAATAAAASAAVGPPIHTLVPLPPGCDAALVGGEAIACSAAGAVALWRPPGLAPARPLAAAPLTPQLPRGASCESASVSLDGRVLAVSVRRRPTGEGEEEDGGGAEVWVYRLAGSSSSSSSSDDEEEEDAEGGGGGGDGDGEAPSAPPPPLPLRLGGHVSFAHMTAGALLPLGPRGGLAYATGDEARRAPVAWRLPPPDDDDDAGRGRPLLAPSLSPAALPAPLPSAVLAVAGARVHGLGGAGGGASSIAAAASAGCVRVYQVGGHSTED